MEHRRISIVVAAFLLGSVPWGLVRGQESADAYAGDPGMASDAAPAAGGPAMNSAGMGNIFPAAKQADFVNAHGEQVVMPAGHYAGWSEGGAPPHGYCGDCGGCPDPYGYGTCPPFDDGMATAGAMAGYGHHQCGPHYFDVRAEAIYLKRDQTFDGDVIFTVLQDQQTAEKIPVLTSSQLEYDFEGGFRIIGRYDVGPLSVFEFGYWGVLEFDTSASAEDPNFQPGDTGDLFSLFSRPEGAGPTDSDSYGTAPLDVQNPDGPMPETDRSFRHTIAMESELHNVEMNYRRYWVGYSPCISGTLLAGFRYTRLSEDFLFLTEGAEEGLYLDHTENDLVGLQTGGDAWLHILQGVRLGTEGKAGIFNNRWEVKNTLTSTSGDPAYNFTEEFNGNQVAFIGEASIDLVLDIFPSLSLRAGYEALWITPVVLAGPNFNTVSPFGLEDQAIRVPFFMDESDVFYHGAHAGVEYIW